MDVGRGEPAVGDQVEELFETQVLASADAEHGYELSLGDRVVCCLSQLVGRDRFAFQVAHHQLFVELDDLLDDHAIGFGGGKRAEGRVFIVRLDARRRHPRRLCPGRAER